MSENQDVNSNAQANQTPQSPVSSGPNLEDMQARLAELERQSEGRLRDLQAERTKRQELEQRLSQPPAAVNNEPTDELGKVLEPYMAPIKKELADAKSIAERYYTDKAMDLLAKHSGKTHEQIMSDTAFQQKLVQTVSKWGLKGNTLEVTQRAVELMELEDLRQKESDRAKAANAAASQTLVGGTPPVPSSARVTTFTPEEFNRLSPAEFDRLESSGSLKKVDGRIVHTPK